MKELIESMMKEGPSEKKGKMDEIAAQIQAVADEMGIGLGEALEQVKEKLPGYEMDDDADEMDDGMDEEEQTEGEPSMDGKKALVIAMLKKKNGSKKEMY